MKRQRGDCLPKKEDGDTHGPLLTLPSPRMLGRAHICEPFYLARDEKEKKQMSLTIEMAP